MRTNGRMRDPQEKKARRMAAALGWFSIGLGTAQLLVPGRVARLVGLQDRPFTTVAMRLMGIREITSGVGLLAGPPAPWLWSRVGGDALDLSLLGAALASGGGSLARTAPAIAAVTGVSALDAYATAAARRVNGHSTTPREVRRSVTIRRPVDEVYDFMRDLERWPVFIRHVDSIHEIDDMRSYWRVAAPGGRHVEWISDIVRDIRGQEIAWRAAEGGDIEHEGHIRFSNAPGDRGTEVHAWIRYRLPAGSIGAAVAKLAGKEPQQQLQDGLRALKQVLEAGEVVHSDASLGGRMMQRPGQPA